MTVRAPWDKYSLAAREKDSKKKKRQINIFSLPCYTFALILDVMSSTKPGACLLLVLPRGPEPFASSLEFLICLFF